MIFRGDGAGAKKKTACDHTLCFEKKGQKHKKPGMQGIIDGLRSHATECIAFMCGDAFLAPGQHRVDCVSPVDYLNFFPAADETQSSSSRKRSRDEGEDDNSKGADKKDRVASDSDKENHYENSSNNEARVRSKDAFGTWLVAHSEMVLVIRDQRRVLVYIPSCDMCYVGDPEQCIVTDRCPASSVFRGQFFLEAGLPRLLIFDVVRLGGVAMRGVSPHQRYAKLQAGWFGGAVVLQWCGLAHSLRDAMVEGKFTVPHEVQGIVEFTEDPMRLRACFPVRRAG